MKHRWMLPLVLAFAVRGEVPPVPPPGGDPAVVLLAFRGVASNGAGDAIRLYGTEALRDAAAKKPPFPATPLEGQAFFSQAQARLHPRGNGGFTAGFYHLWTDQWLLVDFAWDAEAREDRLTAYAWLPGGDAGADPQAITDPAKLATRLRERQAKAMAKGKAALEKGAAALGGDGASAGASRLMRAYAARLRAHFSPEALPEARDLRVEVMASLEKTPERDFPVFVAGAGKRRIVVLGHAEDPADVRMIPFVDDVGGEAKALRLGKTEAKP
jgi:hypothetical protein